MGPDNIPMEAACAPYGNAKRCMMVNVYPSQIKHKDSFPGSTLASGIPVKWAVTNLAKICPGDASCKMLRASSLVCARKSSAEQGCFNLKLLLPCTGHQPTSKATRRSM